MSTQMLSVSDSLKTTDFDRVASQFGAGAESTASFFSAQSTTTPKAAKGAVDDEYAAWLKLAKQSLSYAQGDLSDRFTETRALNVIQLALQCNDHETAEATAIQVLSRIEAGESEFDRAAPQILAQALSGTTHVTRLIEQLTNTQSRTIPSSIVLAKLLVDARKFEEALGVLDGLQGARALQLSGLCHLELGHADQALNFLRAALRIDPRDADACALAAVSYWKLGAGDKSAIFWKRAVRTAPGRRDIWMGFVDHLSTTGRILEARGEIDSIRKKGVLLPFDFFVVDARVDFMEGNNERGMKALRRAEEIAARDNLTQTAEELRVQLSLLRAGNNRRTRREVLEKSVAVEQPSHVLVSRYANELPLTTDSTRLRALLERLDPEHSSTDLLGAWYCLSRLELDFETALENAEKWEIEDSDPSAAAQVIFLSGSLTDDWSGAGVIAERFVRKYGVNPALRNNAAYALALGGQPRRALEILGSSPDAPYYEVATRGLATIAGGAISNGLRLYREAASRAATDGGENSIALMTIHQRMAMRRLGVNLQESIEVEAGTLIDTVLPDGWELLPEMRLLESVAIRNGWGWPV